MKQKPDSRTTYEPAVARCFCKVRALGGDDAAALNLNLVMFSRPAHSTAKGNQPNEY
jgi:hypothetical protein